MYVCVCVCVCARALGEGGNGVKKVMRLPLLIGAYVMENTIPLQTFYFIARLISVCPAYSTEYINS